jgi:hypothetical protein
MSSLLIRNGTVVIDDGVSCVDEGFGQDLARRPFNPRY